MHYESQVSVNNLTLSRPRMLNQLLPYNNFQLRHNNLQRPNIIQNAREFAQGLPNVDLIEPINLLNTELVAFNPNLEVLVDVPQRAHLMLPINRFFVNNINIQNNNQVNMVADLEHINLLTTNTWSINRYILTALGFGLVGYGLYRAVRSINSSVTALTQATQQLTSSVQQNTISTESLTSTTQSLRETIAAEATRLTIDTEVSLNSVSNGVLVGISVSVLAFSILLKFFKLR